MNRVVVTGLGCISPIGSTVEEFRRSLFEGISGIGPLRSFPEAPSGDPLNPNLRFSRYAEVKDFDPTPLLASGIVVSTDRTAQFGILSSRQAVESSGVLKAHDPSTMAIITGCSCGGRGSEEHETGRLYSVNARVHPLTVIRTMSSAGSSYIATEHGITGPVLNISTACSSGTHAIGLAFQMVRSGMVTAALAGGHEAPLTLGFLRAWDSMRVVSPTQCKPFARDRDGMTLGEGAATLVLETLESAQARGAKIYAEIVGFGMSADAHHITQPKAEGAAEAMRRALADAHADASEVGYINAHGTGTQANDSVEATAIHQVFGERGATIPVSSTKALHGHSIGATGAIEALATVLALEEGLLPFNAGVTEVDPTLGLDVILGEPRRARPTLVLSNSLAFGGLNAVLAIRPFTA
ncbi:MAG TPA: beta-ketoacyl-[acyl-carrier-protein] synthase family protein [Granulicella sp.]